MKYCNRKKTWLRFFYEFRLYISQIFQKSVLEESLCVCLSVWLSVWLSPNVEPKLIDRSRSKWMYLVSSRIYLEPFCLVFPLPLKLRVVHIRKKFKISNFSKMALTILIKFYGFIVHSKLNNMTLSAFPGKIPETRKIVFNFLSVS